MATIYTRPTAIYTWPTAIYARPTAIYARPPQHTCGICEKKAMQSFFMQCRNNCAQKDADKHLCCDCAAKLPRRNRCPWCNTDDTLTPVCSGVYTAALCDNHSDADNYTVFWTDARHDDDDATTDYADMSWLRIATNNNTNANIYRNAVPG